MNAAGHAAQFAVHARSQGFQCVRIAIGPGKKKFRRFRGLRFHALVDHDSAKKISLLLRF